MKKKLFIIMLCLLVLTQVAIAADPITFYTSVSATLGEKDDSIGLTGFGVSGKLDYSATYSSKKLALSTNLTYKYEFDTKTYVEGEANIFYGQISVEYNFNKNKLTPAIQANYVDASTIDENTGKITEPGWNFTQTTTYQYNKNVNNFDHGAMIGAEVYFKPDYGIELLSHFGRYNFSYMGKYFASATIRKDNCYYNGECYAGWFPSVALAWRASDEDWFNKDVCDELKFRVSWGKTGNKGVIEDGTCSDWEVATQYNAGIDASFFKGRINGSEDLYAKKIVNDIEEKLHYGNDFMLNANAISTKNTSWNVGFTSVVDFEKTDEGSELYKNYLTSTSTLKYKEFDVSSMVSYNYNSESAIEDSDDDLYEKTINARLITGFTSSGNLRFKFSDAVNLVLNMIDGAYTPDLSVGAGMYLNNIKVNPTLKTFTFNGNDNIYLDCNYYLINNSDVDEPVKIQLGNSFGGRVTVTNP